MRVLRGCGVGVEARCQLGQLQSTPVKTETTNTVNTYREKSSGSFLSNHITVSDEGMKADQGVSFHETKIYLI